MPVLQILSLCREANERGTEGRCCCGTLPLRGQKEERSQSADLAPAAMARGEFGGQAGGDHGQSHSPKAQAGRCWGPGMLSEWKQNPTQPWLTAMKGPSLACIGSFGQIIIVQMTSLLLLLTLAAFKWATRRSKSLYPITSLLSHACPLVSYIILKWQLNGKRVMLPIRRQYDMTALF